MGEKEREAQEEAVLLLLPLAHAEWQLDNVCEGDTLGDLVRYEALCNTLCDCVSESRENVGAALNVAARIDDMLGEGSAKAEVSMARILRFLVSATSSAPWRRARPTGLSKKAFIPTPSS